jgi:alkanesulfonate monooxygenase SsuD/methylene tetrahydromethanopterin reductase-like flavin-dependent oxidoreductase (luciferase family)
VEFGLSRSTNYWELVDDAGWAEQHGFCAIGIGDHFLRPGADDPARAAVLPASDPFVTFAGLARETTSIGLVLHVSAATFRHPAVVLKSAIDIDRMSNGRFTLGVGTGYRDFEHEIFGVPFPPLGERYELMEDHLGYLRAGLAVPNVGFEGKHFRLASHPICPASTGRVRLLVGGEGPRRTPGLAGRYADEYNVFPMDAREMHKRVERARAAAADAGRDPDALLISSGGPIVAGADDAEYREALAERAAAVHVDADWLDRDHREHKRLVGTYEEVATRLEAMADAGVSRVYVAFEGEGALDRERLLATMAVIAPH